MKLITYDYRNTDICIHSNENNIIKGSFFKDKPSIGTIINIRNGYYKVVNIISNIDARVSKNCSKNPEKAFFELEATAATRKEIAEVNLQHQLTRKD